MDSFKKLDAMIAKLSIIRAETDRLRAMSADARALSEAARFRPPLKLPVIGDKSVARAWHCVDPGAVPNPVLVDFMEDEEMPLAATG